MAILQSNGLCEQPMIIGNRFSKGYFFHLSKRHQLCLDCRINTTAQGTNSIVDHIYIETRNEKDSLSIVEVTPQIERNTVFKFDLKPNNANQVPEDTARKLADPQH